MEEACRRHGISQPIYHRWKAKYGQMNLREAQRLRNLEKENGELKELLADQLFKTKALGIALEKTSELGMPAWLGSRKVSRGLRHRRFGAAGAYQRVPNESNAQEACLSMGLYLQLRSRRW